MIPRSFEYFSPQTLDEAVALLQKLGPDAKLLSGGQSLIPMMKLRLVAPEYIIDINRIAGLDYISEGDGHLKIDAVGFTGTDCEKATRFLEEVLGQPVHRERKPEYLQVRQRLQKLKLGQGT